MTDRIRPDTIFTAAVKHWWKSKLGASPKRRKSQGGTRDSNLRGDTMDGFRDAIVDVLVKAGVDRNDIFTGSQFSRLASLLPCYFRASKNWDVIVCKNSLYKRLLGEVAAGEKPVLIAAIEFKSQEGSIGNNQNNRIEESIGSATDFWASYEHKNFLHLQPRPWLGYLFIGKYEEEDVAKSVEIRQPHFPADAAFKGKESAERASSVKYGGPSYAERYRIFLERMIAKKLYDGACMLVTNEKLSSHEQNYLCLFPELSGAQFADGLTRYIRAYYPN